jgi:hypothetical protein
MIPSEINFTGVRERPILFGSDMVMALLSGGKTQTRRLFKLPRGMEWYGGEGGLGGEPGGDLCEVNGNGWWHVSELACPHGDVGDRLWVREAHCLDWFPEVIYKADGPSGRAAREAGYSAEPRYRPSIHMPRRACRIVLEITEVRIHRIQEIDLRDIEAEGIVEHIRSKGLDPHRTSYRAAWIDLWDTINPATPWASNPWTWALTFRRSHP